MARLEINFNQLREDIHTPITEIRTLLDMITSPKILSLGIHRSYNVYLTRWHDGTKWIWAISFVELTQTKDITPKTYYANLTSYQIYFLMERLLNNGHREQLLNFKSGKYYEEDGKEYDMVINADTLKSTENTKPLDDLDEGTTDIITALFSHLLVLIANESPKLGRKIGEALAKTIEELQKKK